MEKTLFQMKMTAKSLERESKRMSSEKVKKDKKAMDAAKKGEMEMARIHGGEAILCGNQSIQFMRLSARIGAVASRVETAARMKTFATSMGQAVAGMESVLATMDPVRINDMMSKFEKQFDNLDVASATMDSAVGHVMAAAQPEAEVDAYVAALMDAAGQAMGADARKAGVGSGAVGVGATAAAPARVAVVAGEGAGHGPAAPGAGGQPPAPGGESGSGGGGGGGMNVADALAARLAALKR